jgi:hypothetical protein
MQFGIFLRLDYPYGFFNVIMDFATLGNPIATLGKFG